MASVHEEPYDVGVIGGGLGGIYAGHRFTNVGLSVVGFESGARFGGVWYHNGYPGARVDLDSVDYCFHFSKEIYLKWRWEERMAAQPELLEYLNWVADECDVRKLFRFETRVQDARWSSGDNRWHLVSDRGDRVACQFLVMCTGQLSEPEPPSFPGLERFGGEWVQTSCWPQHEVRLDGRRIGIFGVGASGVQAVPLLAQAAEQLFVFQRSPHWSLPAQNGPATPGLQDWVGENLAAEKEAWLTRPPVRRGWDPPRPLAEFSPKEARARFERQWEFGGHGMQSLFSDLQTDLGTNDVVAGFIKEKIRETVHDPVLAEKLCPTDPACARRPGMDIGFYETFNRDNVTLVDLLTDPVVEITEKGVCTNRGHYEVDLLIFAIGFRAFSGAYDAAGVRNEKGQLVSEVWSRGPRTLLGLMTPGFPNMFTPTGAGSVSLLANLFWINEYHIDWIADCIDFMHRKGHKTMEASDAAAGEWGRIVAPYAERLLRRTAVDHYYRVHYNDDGSRVFMAFAGGMHEYHPKVQAITANGYEGFVFD